MFDADVDEKHRLFAGRGFSSLTNMAGDQRMKKTTHRASHGTVIPCLSSTRAILSPSVKIVREDVVNDA